MQHDNLIRPDASQVTGHLNGSAEVPGRLVRPNVNGQQNAGLADRRSGHSSTSSTGRRTLTVSWLVAPNRRTICEYAPGQNWVLVNSRSCGTSSGWVCSAADRPQLVRNSSTRCRAWPALIQLSAPSPSVVRMATTPADLMCWLPSVGGRPQPWPRL